MAKEQRYDIILHLDNLTQFFAVSEPDPFDPQARFASRLETIINELKPTALIKRVRTTIILPPDQLAPDGETRLREALARYCEHHIPQNRQELISLRWQGLKALQNGLIFLGACLLLSALFEKAEIFQE